MSLAGLLLAASILASLSFARADAALVQCLDSMTGGEQKRCTQELFQQALDELEATYARVVKNAAEADARNSHAGNTAAVTSSAAIAESQRTWKIYRDAECRGVVGRGDGSGRMVWVFGCLAEKTRDRIRELNVPLYQR